MPTLALVTRDMLHRGTVRFTDELGKAGVMHSMPARRIKADYADMVQALDQTEHRAWLRRFWHLAQPGEPALVGFRPVLRKRIQPTTLVGGEPIGQPALNLATRLIAGLDAEPLERAGRWDDDPAPPALLHHQPSEMRKSVVLDRVRQQPIGQIGGRTRPDVTGVPRAAPRFVADSPLEGGVSCELVSEVKFASRAPMGRFHGDCRRAA